MHLSAIAEVKNYDEYSLSQETEELSSTQDLSSTEEKTVTCFELIKAGFQSGTPVRIALPYISLALGFANLFCLTTNGKVPTNMTALSLVSISYGISSLAMHTFNLSQRLSKYEKLD